MQSLSALYERSPAFPLPGHRAFRKGRAKKQGWGGGAPGTAADNVLTNDVLLPCSHVSYNDITVAFCC